MGWLKNEFSHSLSPTAAGACSSAVPPSFHFGATGAVHVASRRWLFLCWHHRAPMKPLTIAIIVVASIAGIAVVVFALMALDDFIGVPSRAITGTRMWVVKRRILQYAHSHNQLPSTLSVLPVMDGYDNGVRDEWGRIFIYEVSPSGDVRLTSFGRDGKVGGSGKDADMIAVFPSHDAHGSWSDEIIDWSHNPYSQ